MSGLARAIIALTLGLGWVGASAVGAQQPRVLTGRVMAGMDAVPNQPVSLHRVSASGGNTLATDTTDADGRFELALDSITDPEGVQFVATRYDGKLYIGDTFRNDPPPGYALRVGPGATPIELGTPANDPAASAAAGGNSAGLIVLLVGAIILGGIFLMAARQRGESGRRFLVEIAELDNRNQNSARPGYQHERAELLKRLRESA